MAPLAAFGSSVSVLIRTILVLPFHDDGGPLLTLIWAWVLCQVPCGTGEVRQWRRGGGCFYAFRLPSGPPPSSSSLAARPSLPLSLRLT